MHLWLQNEAYRAKLKKSNERSLALVKAALDTVVAIGLLQLAPKKITPRVTGALGFTTSLISCYQVFKLPSCINIYLYEWSDLHAFYLFWQYMLGFDLLSALYCFPLIFSLVSVMQLLPAPVKSKTS